MEALAQNYKNHLEQLKTAIQQSELLALFYENETEDYYKQMIEAFEPHIMEMYKIVANQSPLQLISLEKELLDNEFEGMFLPRILGYAVLRGEIDEDYKYIRPQEHFKDILHAIIESANFDFIKNRIGQTVQFGFAMSSDIWVTNLMNDITNKKVKTFLNHQRIDRFRDVEFRKELYDNYIVQFKGQNFSTVSFPENLTNFRLVKKSLNQFLIYRANKKFDNESILPGIDTFVSNSEFQHEADFLETIMLIGMFYNVSDATKTKISALIDNFRKNDSRFVESYFHKLLKLYRDEVEITPEADMKMSNIINKKIADSVTEYYNLMDVVHFK